MSKLLDFIRKNKEWRTLLKEAPYSLIIKEKTYEQDGKAMHVAIFNYNQIKSDKSDISREARGCIVDVDKCKFVCRGFDRFFNYGESTSAKIDWSTAVIEEKRDGSIIKAWINPITKEMQFSSNGMIDANEAMCDSIYSFMDLIKNTETYSMMKSFNFGVLHDYETLIFELTTPANRIVIDYKEYKMVLLGVRHNETGEYLDKGNMLECVTQYPFDLSAELEECNFGSTSPNIFMESLEKLGLPKNVEGFVIKDAKGNMIKIKHSWYVEAHHNCTTTFGGNKRSIKNLLNVWRANESEEYLAYCPDMKEQYGKIANECDEHMNLILIAFHKIILLKEEKGILFERKDIAKYLEADKKQKYKILWKCIDEKLNILDIYSMDLRGFVVKLMSKGE